MFSRCSLRYSVLRLISSSRATPLRFHSWRWSTCSNARRSALSSVFRLASPGDSGAGILARRRVQVGCDGLVFGRQVAHAQAIRLAQRDHAAQQVTQLAHIAGPALLFKQEQQARIELDEAVLIAFLGRQMAYQCAAVGALAQRRQRERHALQAVIQVFAELAQRDLFRQVAVGGADQADVEFDRRLAAERDHLAFFEHPQQARLQGDRHVADLIEEEGAGIRLQQLAALAFLAGAGKGAGPVAEQFAFDQRLRYRGAIDRDERAVGAAAGRVDGAGEHLLAGAGFAQQHDRHITLEDPLGLVDVGGHHRVAELQRSSGLSGG
jgi:hypothetical protein